MRSKNNEYFVLIEGFVDTYMDSHGISPSTREIATGTGLSTATVSRYMSYMREHGMLDYAGVRNIITKRKRISSTASISVPLLGAVSCGIPKFAEGNIARTDIGGNTMIYCETLLHRKETNGW